MEKALFLYATNTFSSEEAEESSVTHIHGKKLLKLSKATRQWPKWLGWWLQGGPCESLNCSLRKLFTLAVLLGTCESLTIQSKKAYKCVLWGILWKSTAGVQGPSVYSEVRAVSVFSAQIQTLFQWVLESGKSLLASDPICDFHGRDLKVQPRKEKSCNLSTEFLLFCRWHSPVDFSSPSHALRCFACFESMVLYWNMVDSSIWIRTELNYIEVLIMSVGKMEHEMDRWIDAAQVINASVVPDCCGEMEAELRTKLLIG